MYFSVCTALLAIDFCIHKTLRCLSTTSKIYSSLTRTTEPNKTLGKYLESLHLGYKLGLSIALIEEYRPVEIHQDEMALRFVLASTRTTTECIQAEAIRLELVDIKHQSRWFRYWTYTVDWKSEVKHLKLLSKQLQDQIQTLLHLRPLQFRIISTATTTSTNLCSEDGDPDGDTDGGTKSIISLSQTEK